MVRFGASERSYALSIADIDGNGWLDVVVGNVAGENQVFLNRRGEFREMQTFGSKSNTYGIQVADLNGDGKVDVVTANSDDVNMVYLNRL